MPSFYLVRHAKAEDRHTWDLPDAERPLNRRGHEQARLLAAHLADLDGRRPVHIVSSAAVRCHDTVTTLAAAVELPVVDVSWLMEGSEPSEAFEALRKLTRRLDPLSGTGGPVVACSHGDVIWGVLDLLHRLGVDLGRTPDVKKGSVWIIDVPPKGKPSARYLHPDGALR